MLTGFYLFACVCISVSACACREGRGGCDISGAGVMGGCELLDLGSGN